MLWNGFVGEVLWATVRIIGALEVMWPRRWTEDGVWE